MAGTRTRLIGLLFALLLVAGPALGWAHGAAAASGPTVRITTSCAQIDDYRADLYAAIMDSDGAFLLTDPDAVDDYDPSLMTDRELLRYADAFYAFADATTEVNVPAGLEEFNDSWHDTFALYGRFTDAIVDGGPFAALAFEDQMEEQSAEFTAWTDALVAKCPGGAPTL